MGGGGKLQPKNSYPPQSCPSTPSCCLSGCGCLSMRSRSRAPCCVCVYPKARIVSVLFVQRAQQGPAPSGPSLQGQDANGRLSWGTFTLPLGNRSGLHKPPTPRKASVASEMGPGCVRSERPPVLIDRFSESILAPGSCLEHLFFFLSSHKS